jgi:hypothetical protein
LKICVENWDLVPNVERFEEEALRFWDNAPQNNVLQRQRNKKEERWKGTKGYQLKICIKNLNQIYCQTLKVLWKKLRTIEGENQDLLPNFECFEEEAHNN